MDEITCRCCPWHDTLPATNSTLPTCPYCGADGMVYTPQDVAVEPAPAGSPAPASHTTEAPPTPPA